MTRLLVRVDGDEGIGSGHVLRCLALAQTWRRHGPVEFRSAALAPALRERLVREGVEAAAQPGAPGAAADLAAWQARLAAARDEPAGVAVVLDGYHLSGAFQEAATAAGLPCLLVDDHARTGWRSADLVVDANVRPGTYPGAPRVLAGPRYALLRPEFGPAASPGDVPAASASALRTGRPRVLVTLGGFPPADVARRVLEGVRAAGADAVLAVAPDPAADTLAAVARDAGAAFEAGAAMAPLMASCDAAVTAGGTTVLEALRMGLPLLCVVLADNQEPVAQAVAAQRLAVPLGRAEALHSDDVAQALRDLLADAPRRADVRRRAQALVDGRGARRVAAWLRARSVQVRRAGPDDARTVLAWANDPETRSRSFRSDPIPLEDHLAWFAARLADPAAALYVAASPQGAPVGFVWYKAEAEGGGGPAAGRAATVSINLAPEARGHGWGPAALHATMARLRDDLPGATEVLAWVRHNNPGSRSAFLDADFDEATPPTPPPAPAWFFRRRLD